MNQATEKNIQKLQTSINILTAMIVTMTGAIANLAVVAFNGGQMPVITEEFMYYSGMHKTYTSCTDVVLCNFSDKINIGIGYASIGDFLIVSGVLAGFFIIGNGLYKRFKK